MEAGDNHGALVVVSRLERVEARMRVILRVRPALATSRTIRDLTSKFTRRQGNTCARHADLFFYEATLSFIVYVPSIFGTTPSILSPCR